MVTAHPTAAVTARPYGGGYGSPYSGGYGSPYGYGQSGGGQVNQYAVGLCMGAVQQRLDAGYARSQYSGGARVLGVSDVEQRSNGGTLVSGVANSGRSGTYGYNGGQPPVDLTFTCKTDRSGQVSSIEIGQAVASANPYIGNPCPRHHPMRRIIPNTATNGTKADLRSIRRRNGANCPRVLRASVGQMNGRASRFDSVR